MFTRKDYVFDKKCTHREYYAQFVTDKTKEAVLDCWGEKLFKSKDEHLNDLPLDTWDRMYLPFKDIYDVVGDYHTLGNKVCIAKEAARQIIEARKGVVA